MFDKDTGIITTVAGSGRQGYSGDGGPATEATLDNLYSLDVDTNGDIYIVDRLNAAIRKVDAVHDSEAVDWTIPPGSHATLASTIPRMELQHRPGIPVVSRLGPGSGTINCPRELDCVHLVRSRPKVICNISTTAFVHPEF